MLCSNDATCHFLGRLAVLHFLHFYPSLLPHLFNKLLLRVSYVPGTGAGAGDGAVKTERSLHSWSSGTLPDTGQHVGQHGDVNKQV